MYLKKVKIKNDKKKKHQAKLKSKRSWKFTKFGKRARLRSLFCPCPCSKEMPSKFPFSLGSYNLLAPALAEANSYLYYDVHPGYLQWDYRRNRLFKEISFHNADVWIFLLTEIFQVQNFSGIFDVTCLEQYNIILFRHECWLTDHFFICFVIKIYCFQEMQQDQYYEFFYPKLKQLGYYCLFKKRTGDKPDGCSIIFKVCLLLISFSHILFFKFILWPILQREKFQLVSFEFIEYFQDDVESLSK